MQEGPESREAEAAVFEDEIAEVCGILNVATGRLVSLIGQVLDTQAWAGAGVRSAEQWVAWKCGVSVGRARTLVAMARRLPVLPETRSALEAGELAEDQVAVICRHVPEHNDAEAAELARSATVSQLRRTFNRNTFPKLAPKPEANPEPEEARRMSFGFDDDGSWRLSAVLPTDEGAVFDRALGLFRQKMLDGEGGDVPKDLTWADALIAMVNAALGSEAVARPHYDRHLVVVHLEADDEGPGAHVHLGPALPDSLRRLMTCDARVKIQYDSCGTPLSVGRSARTVPDRTRLAVEERDGGCRVPGCDRTKWLHVHHIQHWEDEGPTDTPNLVALCSKHHRAHHRGHLGISGDADDLAFTDARDRPLAPAGRPVPQSEPPPMGNWVHPTGERLDDACVVFSSPPAPVLPPRPR